jgi:hypothetical protein
MKGLFRVVIGSIASGLLGAASFLVVDAFLPASTLSAARTQKFQFQRTGMSGATVVWQGVVVEVTGNRVAPRFTTNNQVLFNSWKDYPAYAIQACRKLDNENCVEVKATSITVSKGLSPYDYDFKFKYRKQGINYQDEFSLTSQKTLNSEEKLKW